MSDCAVKAYTAALRQLARGSAGGSSGGAVAAAHS